MRSKAWRAILWGGLIAGTLDLSAAFVLAGMRARNPRSPAQILRGIASGLLGADALQGGVPVALLGGVLHFFIALTAAAVFYAASRRLKVLVEHAVVCGLAYGVVVYLVMNFVVLPLSAIPFKVSHTPAAVMTGTLVLMFCIGLPIALAVRRFSQ